MAATEVHAISRKQRLTSEKQPQTDLYSTRIVCPNTLEAEVSRIAQVRRREEEIGAIEQVERFRAQLKRHGFSDARLLEQAHVFAKERRRMNIAERRRKRAKEPQRIRVIPGVSSGTDGRAGRIVVEA